MRLYQIMIVIDNNDCNFKIIIDTTDNTQLDTLFISIIKHYL